MHAVQSAYWDGELLMRHQVDDWCVAQALLLYKHMQGAAVAIVCQVAVNVGGSNVKAHARSRRSASLIAGNMCLLLQWLLLLHT